MYKHILKVGFCKRYTDHAGPEITAESAVALRT